jgi:hypothetical protein
MKYLKLFEGFFTDDYYVPAPIGEWSQFKPSVISKDNVNKIISKCNRNLRLKHDRYGGISLHPSGTEYTYLEYDKKIYGDDSDESVKEILFRETISIYEYLDEYFYVRYYLHDWDNKFIHEYIKCDQLEGLFKYLEDRGLLKSS